MCVLTGGAGHICTHERGDGITRLNEVVGGWSRILHPPISRKGNCVQMAGPGDRQRSLEGGATNGVNDDVRVAKRFSRRATHICVQRQYRNTARADGSNQGHSSADRARLHLGLLVLPAPACNVY